MAEVTKESVQPMLDILETLQVKREELTPVVEEGRRASDDLAVVKHKIEALSTAITALGYVLPEDDDDDSDE